MPAAALALALVIAAPPPTGFTSSFERIGLARTSDNEPTVLVDQLGGTVTLRNLRLAGGLVSEVCPSADTTHKGVVVLKCVTRRMWAGLYEDKRGVYLDLRSLRGLPWDGDMAIPLRVWSLRAIGIPDDCPGRLDATRGECAIAAKQFDEAEAFFRHGRTGPDSNFCYLRLGDLAVLKGEPEAAVNLYAFVAPVGPIGRIARSRLCDLTGACMTEKASVSVGDTFALDEPLKSELELMTWRRETFLGREAKVMAAFAAKLQDHPELCAEAVPLCQRMLIAGLNVHDDDARTAALQGWLIENVRHGPYDLDLALAAASAAEDLGAPGFAANVLAATTVPRDQLGRHLLRIVELYLRGRDFVRANVILEYAESKLGRPATSQGTWVAARQHITALANPASQKKPDVEAATTSVEDLSSNVELATELARAASARSRSQEPDHAP